MSSTLRQHTGRTIKDAIEIRARPEVVYDAWTVASEITRWFVDRCEGDMRAGGKVRWIWDGSEGNWVDVFGAERPRYIAFDAGAVGDGAGLMEVFIEPRGAQSSRLRIVNSGFRDGGAWDDVFQGVVSGWSMALAILAHQLEQYPGRSRLHVFRFRPAQFEYEALQPLFSTAKGLESWLAERARIGGEHLEKGTRVELTLRGGAALTGEVLQRTPRELLLSWPEEKAVLALKCFRASPQTRALALDIASWSAPERRRGELETLLDGALDQLAKLVETPARI